MRRRGLSREVFSFLVLLRYRRRRRWLGLERAGFSQALALLGDAMRAGGELEVVD